MDLMPSPIDKTISRKAEALNKDLFKHGQYYYHHKDIVKLLNKLSKYSEAPNNDNLLWGDCISTCINIKNMIHKIGIGGTDILQIVKQCVIACMLDIKNSNYEYKKIGNKDFISDIVPHVDKNCKIDYIRKCIKRRKNYDETGNTDQFIDAPIHKTPSYVHILIQALIYLYLYCITPAA